MNRWLPFRGYPKKQATHVKKKTAEEQTVFVQLSLYHFWYLVFLTSQTCIFLSPNQGVLRSLASYESVTWADSGCGKWHHPQGQLPTIYWVVSVRLGMRDCFPFFLEGKMEKERQTVQKLGFFRCLFLCKITPGIKSFGWK